MDRIAFLKFFELMKNNIGKFLVINLLFLVPLGMLVVGLIGIIPLGINFFDSLDLSVIEMSPEYRKMVLVIYYLPDKISKKGDNIIRRLLKKKAGNAVLDSQQDDEKEAGDSDMITNERSEKKVYGIVYLFDAEIFNKVRKHVFLSFLDNPLSNVHARLLRKVAIAMEEIESFDRPLELKNSRGQLAMRIMVEPAGEGIAQIFFFKSRRLIRIPINLSLLLFAGGFLILAVSMGGITEFTQRMVFHENRKFSYLFEAIKRHLIHSIFISLLITIVLSAIVANIYFYMFVMGNGTSVFVAAINVWLLFFMIMIFLWVLPISVINPEDSLINILKKAVYLCFDNFSTSLDMFLLLVFQVILSVLTLGMFPGISGILAFLNSGIKEVSSRYVDT